MCMSLSHDQDSHSQSVHMGTMHVRQKVAIISRILMCTEEEDTASQVGYNIMRKYSQHVCMVSGESQ